MSTKTCPACGKEFPHLVTRGRNRRYCSDACRRQWNNRQRRLERGSAPRAGRPAERPAPKKRAARRAKLSAPRSPEAWARCVRRRYELEPSEDVLIDLAVDALRLSRDEGQDPRVRLQASGRFQALLRQLNFEEEAAEIERADARKPEKSKAKPPKNATDPRSLLRVVK